MFQQLDKALVLTPYVYFGETQISIDLGNYDLVEIEVKYHCQNDDS